MSGYYDWIGQNIPDQIMEDAASWLALLDSASCTRSDRFAFVRWLNAEPLHQRAFEELSEVWARLHTLTDMPAMLDHHDVIPFPVEREVAAFDDEMPAKSAASFGISFELFIRIYPSTTKCCLFVKSVPLHSEEMLLTRKIN